MARLEIHRLAFPKIYGIIVGNNQKLSYGRTRVARNLPLISKYEEYTASHQTKKKGPKNAPQAQSKVDHSTNLCREHNNAPTSLQSTLDWDVEGQCYIGPV